MYWLEILKTESCLPENPPCLACLNLDTNKQNKNPYRLASDHERSWIVIKSSVAGAVVRLTLKPECYTHNTDSSPASGFIN